MRVYIQWSKTTPEDWTTYEMTKLADFRALPKRPDPTGTSAVVDNQPGWYATVNLQGVIFEGNDHIGFEVVQNTFVVKTWSDNPVDCPPGKRYGQVWTFAPPAPDVKLRNNAMNTVQTVTWYGEPESTYAVAGVPNLLPWSEFVRTDERNTLHGIYMSDELWAATRAIRSYHPWMEWVQ